MYHRLVDLIQLKIKLSLNDTSCYDPSIMTDEQKAAIRSRVEMVERCLRNCNGGNEVHEVGNMRNVVTLLYELLDQPEDNQECIVKVLKRLEKQLVEFFKKKYSHLK